jgi:hypothetical protein
MRRTARTKIASVLAAATIGMGVSVVHAAPAAAWTAGNVWVNFGSWNCPQGGSVVGVHWAVDSLSSGPAGGDWGDNVVYPRVRVGSGSHNTFSYQLHCKKWGWFTYRSVVGQQSLTPYKSGLSYTF